MSPRLRPLASPFIVESPRGVRVRTRLQVTDQDGLVLWALGLYVGCLANHDLALRCAQGSAGGAWRNLRDHRVGLQRAIASIETRLGVPVGQRRGRSRGYATQAERFQKQSRLQVLKGRLAQVEARLAAGRVSVTRGGRELARLHHHLEAAGLSRAQWRERWEAERLFITADGEADKCLGNETIRWHPEEQWLELKLPVRLAFLANRPHGRYRLDCPVTFRHRGSEAAAQATGGAVRYDITYQPERRRWYLDASWRLPAAPVPELKEVFSAGVIGVDLNVGHVAGLGAGSGRQSPLPTAHDPGGPGGPAASTRDGRLRAAISALIGLARQARVAAIAVDARSGRARWRAQPGERPAPGLRS